MKINSLAQWLTVALISLLILSAVAISMWDQSESDDKTALIEQVNNTSSSQENTEEEIEVNEYTLYNYYGHGSVFTPEPMEFGKNITNVTEFCNISSSEFKSSSERKHMLVQFYDLYPTNETFQIFPTNELQHLLDCYDIKLVSTAGGNCFFVSIPTNLTPADIPEEAGIRWMGEWPAVRKYNAGRGFNSSVPGYARVNSTEVDIWINFYEDVTIEDAQKLARKYSTEFDFPYYSIDNDTRCSMITEESNLMPIVNEDIVMMFTYNYPDNLYVPE